MSRRNRMTPLSLLVFGSLMALGPYALAQTAARPAGAQQSPAAPAQSGAPDEENANTGDRYPVFAITSVEILRSQLKPPIDVIAVRALTSAGGWAEGELVPLETGTPPDGVLDLVFVAEAPQESSAPTGYMPIHAVLALSMDHPFKGVRVRSATNSVVLKTLPGVAEAKSPIEACNECVGRYFVAKGDQAPAGIDAGQVLREVDLPPNARVIRATDGIADVRRNPDRLTILVGEDGRIDDAVWE